MALKNVEICDMCKDQLATEKCLICGKDLCDDCAVCKDNEDLLSLSNGNGVLFLIGNKKKQNFLCDDCEDKDILNPEGKWMKEFLADIEFEKLLKERIEKSLALDKLEGK